MNTPAVVSGLKAVVYFLLKYFNAFIFLEKPSIEALRADEEFRPILDAHIRNERPPPSGDRKGSVASLDRVDLPPEITDAGKHPEQLWQTDTQMVNPESAIVVFDGQMINEPNLTDMVICMGGDGTLLHVASIFQDTVPPIISFYMGSLGFLTPFNFADFPHVLEQICTEGGPCILRSRLCCQMIRGKNSKMCPSPSLELDLVEGQTGADYFHILNEATFTRGNCPYLTVLVLSVDGKEVTRFWGDGLIISTPTGSTAYSMSAGASILNPAVPAILVTPINAHSLSCRPLVLPFSTRLEVSIAPDARCESVHLSNDGRLRHHHIIHKDDRVVFTASHFPVPCFGSENQVADWFKDLAHCLHWNARHRQNDFNEAYFLPDRFHEYS
ncbi:NAD kinase [Taenia solium]|eukprot:TsM_000746100 transcript=TsM_000746100 gene=TsM_000746100